MKQTVVNWRRKRMGEGGGGQGGNRGSSVNRSGQIRQNHKFTSLKP